MMTAFAKNVARRLTIVRSLFDRAPAERDMVLTTLPSGDPSGAPAPSGRYSPPAEHSKTATAEDIFYCFRLLLGRSPNPEEWPGHSSRAGEDLENVVSSYVTSREFAARSLLNRTYHEQVELVRLPRFSLFASN